MPWSKKSAHSTARQRLSLSSCSQRISVSATQLTLLMGATHWADPAQLYQALSRASSLSANRLMSFAL